MTAPKKKKAMPFDSGLQKGIRAILAEEWPQIPIGNRQPIQMPIGEPPLGSLIAQLEANLRRSNAFRSKQNWRFTTNEKVSQDNDSSEKVVEKAFARSLKQTDKWANQVPVCSGYSDGIDNKRAIDLVHDRDQGRFKFIELKTEHDSQTVANATVEILLYGLTYILARKRLDKPSESARRLLTASKIDLVVLAPAGSFYTKEIADVLRALECKVDTAVREFSRMQNLGFSMSFSFEVLGEGFDKKKMVYSDCEVDVMAKGIKPLFCRLTS